MQKHILLKDRSITYTLKKSLRARCMRLSVHRNGAVVVTTPLYLSAFVAEAFIREKASWLFSKLALYSQFGFQPTRKRSRAGYLKNKVRAYDLALERLNYFNATYNFHFNSIHIRNQKTRWGSCSKKNNLNFNYKIALLASELADYIIVHELCHLEEFNHSQKFWKLVSKAIPNHKALRQELKKIPL
ncbi:MAG: YgjP-like metallopeptidase domain-containing protein [Patescibacteria group bacterium]